MHVGVSKIKLRLIGNRSLKGKRRIINSLCSRVRSKFNVSIAEVDDNDFWGLATLGITYAGNSFSHVEQVMSNVINFIELNRQDVVIVDTIREILPGY